MILYISTGSTEKITKAAKIISPLLFELYLRMRIQPFHNGVNSREAEARAGVSTAVINRNSAGIRIDKACAGECDIRNIADTFVIFLRADEILFAAPEYLPGFILIKECR